MSEGFTKIVDGNLEVHETTVGLSVSRALCAKTYTIDPSDTGVLKKTSKCIYFSNVI